MPLACWQLHVAALTARLLALPVFALGSSLEQHPSGDIRQLRGGTLVTRYTAARLTHTGGQDLATTPLRHKAGVTRSNTLQREEASSLKRRRFYARFRWLETFFQTNILDR